MAKIVVASPAKATSKYKIRRAGVQAAKGSAVQSTNSDWNLTINRSGTDYVYAVFGKLLEHNSFGEVTEEDFNRLVRAMETGKQSDFDAIQLSSSSTRKYVNPQGALSYTLAGQDNQSITMPLSPSISSEESAGEMMEVYEMAIHRDITFATIEQGSDPNTTRAINTLNAYGTDFKGPKSGGNVTAKTLFRGIGQDETVGPYVSQLLLLPFNYGNIVVNQLIEEELDQANSTDVTGWLNILNGVLDGSPSGPNFSGNSRYIYTPRILASYVHNDALYQAYYNGCQILLQNNVPFDTNIISLTNEDYFVSLGAPDLLHAVAYVAKLALQATWHHKWVINLRLRPETFAGRIHFQNIGSPGEPYGIDPSDNGATTIAAMRSYNNSNFSNDTYLLPLVYPEGAPAHPEYPAGHAVVAGACTTVMKAWFDTSKTWVGDLGLTPMESLNGTTLVNYTGGSPSDASQMTVLGEINKLASNMSLGRNMAGVHYRSAGDKGLSLGESVAIAFLKDLKGTYNERFTDWQLTKFNGSTVTV